jgi:putative hemolysin
MNTTETEKSDWPLGDLEPLICDMRASVGILGHLITTNSSPNNEVNDDEWRKVETDLIDYAKRIETLWNAAYDQRNAEIIATEAEHAAALAAVRAEKAAPGSAETISKANAMWTALRGIAAVTAEYCIEAGYPPRPLGAAAVEPGAECQGMTKEQSRLSSLGDTLREVATDLTGVSDTFSALKVVAEQDRLTPRTLELLQHAVTEAIDEIEQLSDLALGVTVLPEEEVSA